MPCAAPCKRERSLTSSIALSLSQPCGTPQCYCATYMSSVAWQRMSSMAWLWVTDTALQNH
eukprot:359365-Chlamydomonas_euryale.AAC.13